MVFQSILLLQMKIKYAISNINSDIYWFVSNIKHIMMIVVLLNVIYGYHWIWNIFVEILPAINELNWSYRIVLFCYRIIILFYKSKRPLRPGSHLKFINFQKTSRPQWVFVKIPKVEGYIVCVSRAFLDTTFTLLVQGNCYSV